MLLAPRLKLALKDMRASKVIIALLFVLSLTLCSGLSALSQEGNEQVKVSLVADRNAIVPGQPLKLAVKLQMKEGWHTYYKEAGESGMPTNLSFELPPGFKAAEPKWEPPHKFTESGITTYGYTGSTALSSTLSTPTDLKAGSTVKLTVKVRWLACQDMCVPGKAVLSLILPVVTDANQVKSLNADLFAKTFFDGPAAEAASVLDKAAAGSGEQAKKKDPDQKPSSVKSILDRNLEIQGSSGSEHSLPAYFAFAFLGGFILNFMPCVLPVISIKLFSLIKQAGENPKQVFHLGLIFSAGIIASFLALALIVIALKSSGEKIGWGFQFQYPVFVFAMACFITLFALSMFGVFLIDLRAGQDPIDRLADKEGPVGTFFKGVLATVLSTPCTAPFLGPAIGFAFAQPAALILSMFGTVALGMAFPYLVLTAKPTWMKFLPKPGVWMEKLKESMGFLLLATVVWLLWVLSNQVGATAAMAALGFLVVLSMCAWLVGRFVNLSSSPKTRAIVWSIASVMLVFAYLALLAPFPAILSARSSNITELPRNASDASQFAIQWQRFSINELDRQLSAKKTIFLDFTADWCLTCKVNEAGVINTTAVRKKLAELKVVCIKADWTNQDEEITELLAKFGRSGVPLYVIFPAGKGDVPIVLPELINERIVLEALDRAGSSQ